MVDDQEAAEYLPRLLLLLSSPMVALYLKDYLGLSIDATARTAGWGIRTLAAHSGARPPQVGSNAELSEPA